jgi:hypothetical protein
MFIGRTGRGKNEQICTKRWIGKREVGRSLDKKEAWEESLGGVQCYSDE